MELLRSLSACLRVFSYMYTNTVFNQVLQFVPRDHFNAFVGQHNGDRYVKKLTTWNQFVALLYAQATGKQSLRDIEAGLQIHSSQWHHLGVGSVARSSLSDANSRRDSRIFELLFYEILARCKEVTPKRSFSFDSPLYSLDSSTVTLTLSLFPWARYSKQKGALMLHTLLDNRTCIPELLVVTDGKGNERKIGRDILLTLEKGSIVVFDRGYLDFAWWNEIHQSGLFFVTRTRPNQKLLFVGQHFPCTDSRVLADDLVAQIAWNGEAQKYHDTIRRVRYLDKESGEVYEYITNNKELTALQIALIYKDRWRIELFFKWIKQHLKIKTFLGTSKNAVLSQIWVAMCYFLILSFVKFQTKFKRSLFDFTRLIKEALMLRCTLIDILSGTDEVIRKLRTRDGPQLSMWG
jgi:Transposase DDE domain/Domain of unknown function (DUF4372)